MKPRVCPKCKSNNVQIKISPGAAFGAPQMWVCNECGFQSYAVFPEEETEKEETKSKKKRK